MQAVKTWLLTHRDWLLILDNADDLALLPDFLPLSLGGHLLLTTRAVANGRLAHRLEIETFLPEQGALLLLRRAALLAPDAELSQASPQEQKLALQISQEMGGLPLALDQAGAYLEETGADLASYWLIYQQHRADMLRQRRGLVADHPSPVATTWSLSFQKVEEKNSAAADLLRLCAFLSPDAIPEETFTTGASWLGSVLAPVAADAFLLNQAIETLRAYSLVRRNPRERILSIHRLVQAVLQDKMERVEQQCWAERVALIVNATFPHAEYATWQQCERLLPQALLVAGRSETYQRGQADVEHLLCETAAYLQDRVRYQEAELLYQRVLALREQRVGPQHPDVAYLLNNLANISADQGKYVQAESFYQRALALQEQRVGPQHLDVASLLNGLASLYSEQGRYAAAESLYQRALEIWEQQSELEHPDMAYLLSNLADLYKRQSRYAEAESLYQRVLGIGEQQLGPQHSQVADPLNNLAILCYKQKKYREAEMLYQHALSIREQQLGPQHPDVAYPLNGLAILYHEQGKYAEAESLYQRALEIWEQQMGAEHLQITHLLINLTNLYQEQHKYTEAESLYQRTLLIKERQLGPGHLQLYASRQRVRRSDTMRGREVEK